MTQMNYPLKMIWGFLLISYVIATRVKAMVHRNCFFFFFCHFSMLRNLVICNMLFLLKDQKMAIGPPPNQKAGQAASNI